MSKSISNRYGILNSKLMCAVFLSSSMVLSGCGEVSKEERLAIADAASESGKYDDALIQLRSIVLSEPSDMVSREKLAKVYFNIGNLSGVIKELELVEESVSLKGKESIGMLLMSYLFTGSYEDAILFYQRSDEAKKHDEAAIVAYVAAIKNGSNPRIETARVKRTLASKESDLFLAVSNYVNKNFANAKSHIDKVDHPFFLFPLITDLKAQLAMKSGENEKAVEYMTEILGIWPNIAIVQITSAHAFALNGEYDKAFNIIGSVPPDTRSPWLDKISAEIYLRKNENESALKSAEEAIDKGLSIEDNFIIAGTAAFKLGRNETSYEYLKKAYAKNPQNAYTMRLLSGVSIELGYVDESIELMKAADFSNADNVAFIANTSEYLSQVGKNQEAGELIKEVHSRDPANASLLYKLIAHNIDNENFDSFELDIKRLENLGGPSLQLLAVKLKKLIKDGQYEQAIALIEENRTNVSPDESEILSLLYSTVQVNNKQYQKALDEIEKIEDDENPDLLNLKMLSAYGAGQLDLATNSAKRLVELNQNSASVLQLLQMLEENNNLDTESALRRWKAKSDSPALYDAGLIYLYIYKGEPDRAFEIAQSNEAALSFIENRLWLNTLIELGDKAKILSYTNKLLTQDDVGENPKIFADIIAFYLMNSFNQEALSASESALNAFPDEVSFKIAKLESLINLGALERAEVAINSLKNNDVPKWLVTHFKGLVSLRSGDVKSAKSQLEQALLINPSVPTALLVAQINKESEPLTGLNALESVFIDSNNEKDLHTLAEYAASVGFFDRAQAYYDKIIQNFPESHIALNNKANILIEKKKFTEAIELADKAYNIRQNPAYLDTKGWAEYKAGQVESAVSTFKSLLESQPRYEAAAVHLAEIYIEQGDRASALKLKQAFQSSENSRLKSNWELID
ncbi:tetratricopeptide repeat protein [Alteromonas gracilis]|uniref:tetratricopeptide repeat protein n=1 Tax=Alteromonas gracilis TaxID=1479524 RepID=UPI0030D15178